LKQGEIALPILGKKSPQCPEYDNNFTLLSELMTICSKVHTHPKHQPCSKCPVLVQCQQLFDHRAVGDNGSQVMTPPELWRAVVTFSKLWNSAFSHEIRILNYLRTARRPVSRREIARSLTVTTDQIENAVMPMVHLGLVESFKEPSAAGKYIIFYKAKYKI
jgi:hypothetical protein